jgi:hypothetical protein
VTRTPNGGEIHRTVNGRIGTVRAHGMDIHYGPGRSRTIVRERADRSIAVSNRYDNGYIQRNYVYRGAPFVQRTYYVNGVAYSRVYRPYTLGAVAVAVYAPAYYYSPGFYGWAYTPWGVPAAYPWGWAADPWYGYYAGYFTPYPAYAGPSLWLTDYMMAETLQAAYLERAAELANTQLTYSPLTPEVKQQIADEVNRQISLENHEASTVAQADPDPGSSGIERMLTDNTSHAFVVSSPLFVQSSGGECSITEGDVLGLMLGAHSDLSAIHLAVLASKGDDCSRGSVVSVSVADLQEMQNHMRETIDEGLEKLQSEQGRNGVPPAPQEAAQPPVKSLYAEIAPPLDPGIADQLSAQNKEAQKALQETLSQTPGGQDPADRSASEPRLTQGETVQEVLALVGEKPQDVFDSGTNRIYVFSKVVVTFAGGRVVKIEE